MKYLLLVLFYLSFLNSFSQEQVEVRYEYDNLGDAWFRVYNDYDIPVFLVVDFGYLN